MKHFKINPLFFVTLILSVLLGVYKNFIFCFFALLFHEGGHLLFIKKNAIEINYVKIEPFGITVRLKDKFFKNPREEIMVLFAGPLFNFIFAFLSYLFFRERLLFFTLCNLSLGLFNLLPVYPLDGGGILRAMLSINHGYLYSYKKVYFLTKALSIFIAASGLFIFYITRFNFTICLIGAFLIFNLANERNTTYFYLQKELCCYKEKNKDIEKLPVRHIAVNKDFYLRKIIKDLSFSGYHIFSVVDKGKILKTFTEGELMEGLIKHGGKVKISDLI